MKDKFYPSDRIVSQSNTTLKGILKKDKRETFHTECEYSTIVDLFHDNNHANTNHSQSQFQYHQSVDENIEFPQNEPSIHWNSEMVSADLSESDSDLPETIALRFREDSFTQNENSSWVPKRKIKTKAKRPEVVLHAEEDVRYAKRGVRLEAYAAVINIVVILLCIIVIALMSKLSNDWAKRRRRCPIYVKSSPSVGIYWGNEHMLACSYSAYVPIVNVIISLSTLFLNSSMACAYWRRKNLSKLLFSTRYASVMSLIHICNASIMLSVACVLTDGLRQTCLSFQLNPWAENRPESCKLGYADRDDAYYLHGTYPKLLVSLIFSWLSAVLLLVLVFLYFTRSKFCR